MAMFSKALNAVFEGYSIRSPSGLNKWIELRNKGNRKKLMHWTIDYGWLEWLPNQTELLSDDWEIQ